MTWLERLRDLLCTLLTTWLENCEKLGETPSEWVAEVVTVYAEQGPPPLEGQAAVLAFLNMLTELEEHLDEPGNSLTVSEDIELRTLISALRSDFPVPK